LKKQENRLDALFLNAVTNVGIREDDMPDLIRTLDKSPMDALFMGNALREKKSGNKIDACSIINARSGGCSEDCAFCAQSGHHSTDAEVYPLIPVDAIVDAAKKAHDNGVRRFCVVTSGRGVETDEELSLIAESVGRIRDIGIMPCATLGALTKAQMTTLKDAGLNRFHHNIETSRSFFPNVCTTHTFDERVETLNIAREVGLSLCSGGIIGMGETMADRAEMALSLRDLDVDSVPINFLTPIPGTPLEDAPPISPMDALKTVALFRFILPDKDIRVCGGRARALRELHPMIFMAGANGFLMGDYLTTKGRNYEKDLAMLDDLRLTIGYD